VKFIIYSYQILVMDQVGESIKASHDDRGIMVPEFDSPGEHSCSHT